MVAGMNCEIKVWHIDYASDDTVGGAVVTGTVSYSYMDARIEVRYPEQLLLQQGLETFKTYTCFCRPEKNRIYERDEIEVIRPINHRFYGERFRVRGVSETSTHPSDGRGFVTLFLTRSEEAHASQ